MDSPELIPIVFILSFSGYHFRTIWRVYRDNNPTGANTLAETWLKHWHRPEVTKSALRCASRSLGVFLGIEIAEDDTTMMKPLDQESSLEIRYQQSITTLLDLALQESHKQARIAASVLLSANRSLIRPSQEWLVSVPDIGLLNERERNAALGVIHGRITLKRNPETVLQGGTALFSKLWHRWRNVEKW